MIDLNISESYNNINSKTEINCDIYNEEFIKSGLLSNLSITNKTIRRIAHVYSIENGFNTCIILNEKKNIVEGTIGNIYLIKENKIITPNLSSGCENTAIRSSFNKWVSESLKFEEVDINVYDLQQCDELFFLSSVRGYTSVKRYRKTIYKSNLGIKLFKSFILSV